MFRDRIQTGHGERSWESVIKNGALDPNTYGGKWEVLGSSLTVNALTEGAWLCATEKVVEDFEFKTALTAVSGGRASIFFRQHENGMKCYEFDLQCELQAIVVTIFNGNDKKQRNIISAVNYEILKNKEYDIEIAMRGESITTYVNGQLVNQVRDGTYRQGHICLTAWHSKARFRDPKILIY